MVYPGECGPRPRNAGVWRCRREGTSLPGSESSGRRRAWLRLADAFIQLIKTVTGPVIFVTVVIGVSALGNLARAGGLAVRALGYFLVATIIALALGLLAGNIVKPGNAFEGQVSADARADAKESISEAGGDQGIVAFITDDLLPTSFVAPFVENEILRVLILALLTAAAVSGLAKPQRERIVAAFELAAQVIFRMIRIIMWAAPLGAFGGMAFTVAKFGGRHSRASAC